MNKVKVLGDHSQSKTTILLIGLGNIILSFFLPFVGVFTSSITMKKGLKTKKRLKFSLNLVALTISVIQMIVIPFWLASIVEKPANKPIALSGNVSVLEAQIRPKYIEQVPSSVSVVGEVEGIVEKTLEEASEAIAKNLEQSKTFYKGENFKLLISRSDSDVVNYYIYDKEHPEFILSADVVNNSYVLLPFNEVDVFKEQTLKDNVFEKGSVVVSNNETKPSVNDVFIAVQGKSVTYGVLYQTDDAVNYAMQKLNKIIINVTDSVITTYEFTPAEKADLNVYNLEYEKFVASVKQQ